MSFTLQLRGDEKVQLKSNITFLVFVCLLKTDF